MYRVNVLENVINRQDKKNRRRTVSTFVEKRDKPDLKLFCYFGSEEIFSLTMMYLLKKFRESQTTFPGNLEKIHCNPKELQREGVIGVVLLREEKAFSEKKEFYKSH